MPTTYLQALNLEETLIMENNKRIRITDMGQTKIFGICAKSFQELQKKGRDTFKHHNIFLIQMNTGELIEKESDFKKLNSKGEMVKFTSNRPRESIGDNDEILCKLEKLAKNMFNIKTFSFADLDVLKEMKVEHYTNFYDIEFLERVKKVAVKAVAWKEFDADSEIIKSCPVLPKEDLHIKSVEGHLSKVHVHPQILSDQETKHVPSQDLLLVYAPPDFQTFCPSWFEIKLDLSKIPRIENRILELSLNQKMFDIELDLSKSCWEKSYNVPAEKTVPER